MNTQKTLVILKPDCTRKNLIGKVIARFEEAGFQLLDMRMEHASYERLYAHYETIGTLLTRLKENNAQAEQIFASIIDFMQSGTVVPILFEREDAIAAARTLAGATRPWEAEKGTIRADFGRLDPDLPIENVVHASANPEEAVQEIALWFPDYQA